MNIKRSFSRCSPPIPPPTAASTSASTRFTWAATAAAGRVYPTGEKSNNAVYTAPATGTVAGIEPGDNGSSVVTITGADGSSVAETVPVGPALLVSVGDNIEAGAALTDDPNVGGFGQVDAEVVLQNPVRIYGLLAFFAAVALAQIMLVLKKRQIEKVPGCRRHLRQCSPHRGLS